MMHLLALLQHLAAENQFFSGVAGVSVIGAALFWLRSLPAKIWRVVVWAFSIEVEISNDTVAYPHLLRWIGAHGERWHIRKLKLGETDNDYPQSPGQENEDRSAARWMMAPGRGSHCIWRNGWPYFIRREITNEQQTSSSRVREVINVRTPGFSRRRLRGLVDELMAGATDGRTLFTYVFHMSWEFFDRRFPRPLASIVPQDVVQRLAADVRQFLGAFQWYAERGVPYRRGYLFCGAPGTGKSSTALALAGEFKLPIYVLNLGSVLSDASLIEAISNVPPRAMLLIEDIDAGTSKVHTRRGDEKESLGITLSGLLNCLDGAMAKDGRILVMTTNHPERIDAALLRAGRVDLKVEFAPPGAQEAAELFRRFFGHDHLGSMIERRYEGGLSQADIQAICLEHVEAPEIAARIICDGKTGVTNVAA